MAIDIPLKIGDKRLVWSPLVQKWQLITVGTISVVITKEHTYIFLYADNCNESFSYEQSKGITD